jgi:hypothetical protein
MEPDKARKTIQECVQPLTVERRLQVLSPTVTQKQVPLIQWMKDVAAHVRSNGMDGVFYAINKSNQQVDLLDQWSQMTMSEVTEWYEGETWDSYDMDNLRMSGKFIRDSISNELYQRILFAIQGQEVGPLIYVAAVQDMQQIGTVAARMMVDEIQKLHIHDIPGEDVKTLTTTLFEYCSRLEGVQAVPFDLAGIVTACFLESATLAFNMEVHTINKLAQVQKLTWQQVLTMVGTEYQTLLGNGQWKAKIIKGETSVQKALKAEIKKEVLSELRRLEPNKGAGTPSAATNEGKKNPNIICHHCKEKGHISRICPKKDSPAGGNGGGGGGDKNQTSNPYKIKPKDGESKVKTINNVSCTWCDRCRRWTSGDKRHTTEEHKPRSELQGNTLGNQAGNLATSGIGGGLIMTHFHGAGHA